MHFASARVVGSFHEPGAYRDREGLAAEGALAAKDGAPFNPCGAAGALHQAQKAASSGILLG